MKPRNMMLVISATAVFGMGVLFLSGGEVVEPNSGDTNAEVMDRGMSPQLSGSTKVVVNRGHDGDELSHQAVAAPVPLQKPNVDYIFKSTAEYEAASVYGELPLHARDIAIARLSYDANGNLIVTKQIRQAIEFFLSVAKEEGREQAISRLREYIDMTLPENAANQALVIVDQYLEYKNHSYEKSAPINYEQDPQIIAQELDAMLEKKKALRRQYLPEDIGAIFYGREDAYDKYSIERIKITNNPALSDDEKDQLFARQEDALPADMGNRLRHNRQEKNLKAQIKTLQGSVENASKIHALREAFYGAQVAERLAYLEDNSGDWRRRVEAFNQEKTYIQQLQGLTSSEKEQMLFSAKNNAFSQKERVKLAVQNIRNRVAQVN